MKRGGGERKMPTKKGENKRRLQHYVFMTLLLFRLIRIRLTVCKFEARLVMLLVWELGVVSAEWTCFTCHLCLEK